MTSTELIAAICILTTIAGAQITSTVPPVIGFVDISTSGGTQIFGISDDSEHNIVTTMGNPLFPAGNVRIGNNGVAISGATTGDITFSNTAIPPTGAASLPAGSGAICAFWDDLFPQASGPPTSIFWKEDLGVLYIMWKDEYSIGQAVNGQTITFEIQVFSAPALGAPSIQIIYPDAVFGGLAAAHDNGLSATVGYVKGTNPVGNNAQWSFNTASVPSGTVLSIFPPGLLLTASSPPGPGSIQLDIVGGPSNGTYFLAATVTPGVFPTGWLFGLDITFPELAAELAAGFPFTGPLDALGNFSLGPFQGLPSITICTIAFGFIPGSPVPSVHSAAISHAIP